ncbi:hypothetical protein KFV02_06390 [Desulfohalobiaceae bacterium Ax17]|jgi:hypothetical protein|uniref:hypothetical protein n=1 Tax=Desulfovulcanus ferrireducens TaxID=2831190 RepID=UPI00207BAE36|nr:hypothetical protein [Desulfovulcanus ferrireducens]MBT8763559.1 hypothetical protein [Desulfovulcanus ferrireducens]
MEELFVFRLNKLKILDSREWGPGELKILSFITGEDVNLPVLDDLQRTTDPERKKQLIKVATQSVLSSKVLMQLDNVRDGHQMTFGDTGYALYTAQKIPESFNWRLIILEIDEDVNNLGRKLDNVINAPEFDGFVGNVLALASAAANPAAVAGVAIAKYVFGIIADTMIENKDDQVGLVYQSFTREEHYPHGERKRDNVPDLSNNVLVDYSIFGTTYERPKVA